MAEPQPAETAGSNVVHLRPADVVDGEIVTTTPRQTWGTRILPSEQTRQRLAVGAVELHHRATPAVVTGAKALARHVLYIAAGAAVVHRRRRDARTASPYVRALMAAEAAGKWEEAGEWADRIERVRDAAHRRRMDWLNAPVKLAKAAALAAAAGIGLLLALGVILAVADGRAELIVEPIGAAIDTIRWLWWVATAYGLLLTTGAVGIALAWLHHLGRRHSTPPRWAQPARQRAVEGEPVTAPRVIAALRELGIADLRRKLVELGEDAAHLLGQITIAGCGVEVDVTLPRGIDTEQVKARRRKLAENLDRHEHELFITVPPTPRTVRLWIADSGALDEPIEPSPLVTDPDTRATVHSGRAPWGQNLRGDAVALNLWQKHLLITGLSNMGKTAALRALVLWLAHDPTTELRIADLKGIGDWRMFRGIASTLIEGPTDDHVIAATEMLEWGVAEMERRLTSFDADKYPDGVPPGLPGFHPVYLVVDEAQVAFMSPVVGEDKRPYGGTKATSRYFMAARKIHNQGRAVNVMLWQGTQDPTDQNLPKLVREGAHIRASLKVGTPEQARMAMGANAVNAGAAPHELRQEHKGTVVVTGAGVPCQQGQTSETVRTHFIGGQDAVEVAERIKAIRGEAATARAIEQEPRDLLADVVEVLRDEERVKTTDVAARLRKLAPTHRPYAQLDGTRLREQLEAAGVRVTMRDGYPQVHLERVQAVLVARDVVDGE